MPASRRHSYSLAPENEPWGLGLSTTVLPATSAPPAGPAASAMGKLKGLMTPQTPYGRITLRVVSCSAMVSIACEKPSLCSIWVQ